MMQGVHRSTPEATCGLYTILFCSFLALAGPRPTQNCFMPPSLQNTDLMDPVYHTEKAGRSSFREEKEL